MSISNVIPQLWAARLLQAFDRALVWNNAFTDVSELVPVGSSVHIGELVGDVTIADYTREMDITAPEYPDDADNHLQLNRQKYFNIAADDLDRIQSVTPILDEWARKASVAAAEQADDDLVTSWTAGNWAAGTSTTHTLQTDTPNDMFREGLLDKLMGLVKAMDDANVPVEGRFCIIPTNTKWHLLKYLVDQGVGTGAIADQAFVQAQLSALLGLNVFVDTNLNDGNGANNPYAYMGHPSTSVMARQVANVEAYRPERRFADAIKGLFVYGALNTDLNLRWRLIQAAS